MLVFSTSVLSDGLSGFLKGHSCTTALLKVTEDFRATLDDKEPCAAIAVDLSKAFDSVSQSLLLSKLRAYGFSDSALCLTRLYLYGRKARVKIGNSYSDWKTIKYGVPQGSILGPLLFNLFINDLTYFVVDANLRLYADDTTQYLSNRNPNVLEFTSQNSFDMLQSWFKCNYLSVNEAKTKVLSLGDNPTHLQLFADRTRIKTLGPSYRQLISITRPMLNVYVIKSMLKLLLWGGYESLYLLMWWSIFTRPSSYHTWNTVHLL